jgi:hypothetical protein
LALADIECCHESVNDDAGRTDIKAMGIVMMAVMEKDSQPKGSFGLQHPERWSHYAVDFFSKTEFFSVAKLAQVSHQTDPTAGSI